MLRKLARVFREPLVHFLVIGAGFFLYWHYFGEVRSGKPEPIVITSGQVERLAQAWTKTRLRPPTADELAQMVEQEIDEEILYREAIALRLDQEDAVIRKRLAVKMDFLTDDAAAEIIPTEEQLQTYLKQHPEKFNTDTLTSFSLVFINRSQGETAAAKKARHLLSLLSEKNPPDWRKQGDSLPLPSSFESASPGEIIKLFGRDFPKKLAELPEGRWRGPVESPYGLHLVFINKRSGGKTPPLAEVREAVLSAWGTEQRQGLAETLRRQRRARYAVSVQLPDWAKNPPPDATSSGGSR